MNCTEIRELLNDHVDGTLDAVAQEQVFQHLRQCRECTLEHEALRALAAAAGQLPRRVMPERDLWPGIARSIAGETGDAAAPPATEAKAEVIGFRRRHRWPLTTSLAVAASFLVAVAFGALLLVQQWRGQEEQPGTVTDLAAAGDPAPVTEANGNGPELALVRRLLEPQMGASSSETLAVLKESFRELDRAAARAREALKENPEDRRLALMLASIYRNKMQILERTVRLSV